VRDVYLNTDVCKFESSHKKYSRDLQSGDYSKGKSKPWALVVNPDSSLFTCIWFDLTGFHKVLRLYRLRADGGLLCAVVWTAPIASHFFDKVIVTLSSISVNILNIVNLASVLFRLGNWKRSSLCQETRPAF